MSRDAKEGVVVVSGDESKTSVIEVNCETDFVAKNEDFINFVKELREINNKCSSDIDLINKTKMKNKQSVEENLIAILIDKNNNDYLNDVLNEGAKKARLLAQEKILAIKEIIGISKIN